MYKPKMATVWPRLAACSKVHHFSTCSEFILTWMLSPNTLYIVDCNGQFQCWSGVIDVGQTFNQYSALCCVYVPWLLVHCPANQQTRDPDPMLIMSLLIHPLPRSLSKILLTRCQRRHFTVADIHSIFNSRFIFLNPLMDYPGWVRKLAN